MLLKYFNVTNFALNEERGEMENYFKQRLPA